MTFPYQFPFTFPGAAAETALPITGWWAGMSGSAAANVTPSASASIAHLAASATLVTPVASATGFLTVSKAATATVTPSALASGYLTLSQSAAAIVTPTAAAVGAILGQGSAAGNATPTATASGTTKGIAAATATPTAAAAGHLQYTGTSAVTVTPAASSTGHLTYTGTAAATATPTASAAGSIPAAVAYDALGGGYLASSTTGTTTPSWSHTITGSGIVVFVDLFCNTASPTMSATVGGTAMTSAGSINYYTPSSFWAYLFAFYLQTPPTGSQTVALSFSAGTAYDVVANSASYSGVTGFGTPVTASNSFGTTSPSMTASSATSQMVANAFGGYTTTFSAYSGNSRWNEPLGAASLSFLIGDAAGSSTVTLSATGTQPWGGIAIPVQ